MKKTIKVLLFTIIFLTCKNTIKAADYIWPINENNAYETYIEYNYGRRTYDSKAYDIKNPGGQLEGYYLRNENHYGIDITGIKGHTYDVISVVDGTVLTTSLDQLWNPSLSYPDRNQRNISFDGGGYGNYIVIKEDKTGKCFLYGHLKANTVTLRNGQKVTKGQKLGVMGSSGDSGHMHLHFEVRLNQQYTTTGKNLVITTTYGLETLDPTKFIGTKAPEKPEVKQEISQSIKPSTIETNENNIIETKKINTLVQPTNIEFLDYKTFGRIKITFDKEIKELPQVEIIVNNEIKNAVFSNKANNTYTYKIRYNEFNVTTYGNIQINIKKTNEVDNVSKVIGYLNEYQIPQTYEDSYYYRLGDLNKDGYIDSVDASQALSLYSKIVTNKTLTPEEEDQKTRADMNKDGYIDSTDASLILNYYTNKSTNWTDSKQEKIIACDITGDHIVSLVDYNLIKEMVNQGKYNLKYDLNRDDKVDQNDLDFFMQVLEEYGKR